MNLKLKEENQKKEKILIKDRMMLTIDEAKDLLGIARNVLESFAEAGFIEYIGYGSQKRFPRWALEEFTYNFVYKRINLQTLEVTDIENNHDQVIKRLKKENKALQNKLDGIKRALL